MLVHVGFPKTGTSFLQEAVWSRHPALRLVGPAGPGLPPPAPEREAILALKEPAFPPHFSDTFKRLEDTSHEVPTIVSVESLVGDCFDGCFDRERVAERLATELPMASILITVRSQAPLLRSVYSQYVNQGGYASTAAFFAGKAEGAERFDLGCFRFHEVLDAYSALFGPERVHVLVSERLWTDPLTVAAETLSLVGLGLPDGLDLGNRRNVTIPPAGLSLLRASNRLFRRSSFNAHPVVADVSASGRLRYTLQRRRVSAAFRRLADQRVELPEWVESRLAEVCGGSNDRLAEALGVPLQSFGYPSEHGEALRPG